MGAIQHHGVGQGTLRIAKTAHDAVTVLGRQQLRVVEFALPDATRQLWKAASGIEMLDGIGGTEMFHIFISAAGADVKRGAIGRAVPGRPGHIRL